MIEYYPVLFIVNDNKHFCCWFGDENDGFVVVDNKLVNYETLEELSDFAGKNHLPLKLDDNTVMFSIDQIQEWSRQKYKLIGCREILDFWNIVRDISASLDLSFYGNKRTAKLDKIYEKLFWGNNISAVTPKGKSYVPEWQSNELQEIDKVILDGIKIVSRVL